MSDDAEKNLKKAASLDRLFDDVDEDKFERLSNKQLMDVIADAVDGAMKANSELVKQDIVKMSSADKRRFEELEKATMSVIAHMGVAEARKKFTDFDVYKDDIGKVLEQYPNVGYEDAYLMAKSRKAGAVPPRSSVESEKPDSFGTAPTGPKGNEPEGDDAFAKIAARGRRTGGRQTEGQNSQSGVVGFRSFADAAIEKYLDSLD